MELRNRFEPDKLRYQRKVIPVTSGDAYYLRWMRDSLPSIRRFSTDDLPEQSRTEVFREAYGRTIIKIDIEPLPEHPFRFDALFCSLPGIGVAAGSISPSCGVLTSNLIDSDDVLLNVSLSGGRVIQQRGRETDVISGEGALTTSIDPGVVTIHSPSRFFSFRVARTALQPMIGGDVLTEMPAAGPRRPLASW